MPKCLDGLEVFQRGYAQTCGHDGDADESFPVGKVDRLNMYPMTFAEFVKADGKDSLVKAIEDGDWHTVAMLSKDYEKGVGILPSSSTTANLYGG